MGALRPQRDEQKQTEAAEEIARVALRKITVAEASRAILTILEDVVPRLVRQSGDLRG